MTSQADVGHVQTPCFSLIFPIIPIAVHVVIFKASTSTLVVAAVEFLVLVFPGVASRCVFAVAPRQQADGEMGTLNACPFPPASEPSPKRSASSAPFKSSVGSSPS